MAELGTDQNVTVDAGSTSNDAGTTQVDNSASTVRDFSDNDLVRIPGQTEPVRYGDLYKRLQGDHTRKTQAVAAKEAAIAAREGKAQQQEQYLKNLAASLLAKQNAGQTTNQEDNLLNKLEKMQYLDGSTAAKLFKEIQEKGFGTIVSAIQERDQIIQAMYRKQAALEQTLNQMQGRNAESEFDTKLKGWLRDGGYPEGALNLAKEVYLAYEQTPELDQEFPEMFQKRWNEIQGIFRAQDKARVDAAKKRPFGIPGKGGNGVAGKPSGLKGNESSKEVADILWEALQASSLGET